MKMKSLFILSLLMLALTACESDPFPKEGQIVNTDEPTRRHVPPPYTIDVLSTLQFKEGTERSYPLRFFVPSGSAVYSFEGLPDGMTYDEVKQKITWQPDFDAANDPNDPKVKIRRIPMEIWLRSSLDENTAIKKDVVLEIKDTPRNFDAGTDTRRSSVNEGHILREVYTINNEDFPNGPFKVRIENLPNNLELTADGNSIKLEFAPDHFFVTIEDDCSYYSCQRGFPQGKIIVTAPDGREMEIDQKITVNDERLDPIFSTPSVINQGLDVNFIVSAYDPNAEVNPEIELMFEPTDGDVELQEVKSVKNSLKQTHKKFVWKNIPARRRGTEEEFRFRACTMNPRRNMDNCITKNVKVKIKEQTHLAPVFKRENWELGHVEYIGFNKAKDIALTIQDGNNPLRYKIQSVEVYPKEMRRFVRYVNGYIKINDNEAGLKQFKLLAKSEFGIESSESFTYEVLPKNWSKNLALINSFRSNEIVANRAVFQSIDVANSDFQKLDRRMLSERETLIIGTDSLKTPEQIQEVEKIASGIQNIIISTPLLKNFNGTLSKEIGELGIVSRGRFDTVVSGQLSNYYFLVGRDVDLEHPRRRVFLSGNLTAESLSPMLLNKKINSDCVGALSIGDDVTGLDHLISVKCERKNGGYLIINGFEIGDLKPSLDDSQIGQKWMKKLMEKR